jgi:hypothetical protein
MPDGSHRGDVGVEETGLAKAPRGRESDRHAISGRALERIELEPPINERVRLNGTLIAERIHRTRLYGLAGQSWLRACVRVCPRLSLAEFDAVCQDWAARRHHVVAASISPDRRTWALQRVRMGRTSASRVERCVFDAPPRVPQTR